MNETKIRNKSEFKINPEAEQDFNKIFEDYSEEEFFAEFYACRSLEEQDHHKLVV